MSYKTVQFIETGTLVVIWLAENKGLIETPLENDRGIAYTPYSSPWYGITLFDNAISYFESRARDSIQISSIYELRCV